MSDQKKLFVVFGATGAQGGAVVKYFTQQSSSPYRIRAVTRDVKSAKAQALVKPNVELAQAELSDEASLKKALDGANVVFLVTDYWGSLASGGSETEQGKLVASILANVPTLEHFVWSSLPSVSDATGGKFGPIYHFDGKADVDKYMKKEYPDLWAKTTVLWLPPYFQLFEQIDTFAPRKKIDERTGKEIWVQEGVTTGDTKWWAADVSDTGVVVNAILRSKDTLFTKFVPLVGERSLSIQDFNNIWGRHVNREVSFRQVTPEKRLQDAMNVGMPEFAAQNVLDLQLSMIEFTPAELFGGDDVVFPEQILNETERLTTWEEFVHNKSWDKFLEV